MNNKCNISLDLMVRYNTTILVNITQPQQSLVWPVKVTLWVNLKKTTQSQIPLGHQGQLKQPNKWLKN